MYTISYKTPDGIYQLYVFRTLSALAKSYKSNNALYAADFIISHDEDFKFGTIMKDRSGSLRNITFDVSILFEMIADWYSETNDDP